MYVENLKIPMPDNAGRTLAVGVCFMVGGVEFLTANVGKKATGFRKAKIKLRESLLLNELEICL